jgi:hypothetical protein
MAKQLSHTVLSRMEENHDDTFIAPGLGGVRALLHHDDDYWKLRVVFLLLVIPAAIIYHTITLSIPRYHVHYLLTDRRVTAKLKGKRL